MLAGPNGSGKSTLLEYLRTDFDFPLGFCLNPDDIDRQLQQRRPIKFDEWNIRVQGAELMSFIRAHPLAKSIGENRLTVRYNALTVSSDVTPGYLASIVADFMRRYWIRTKQSFTFETVMSSRDKVQLLERARHRGYRTYLYYVCTEDPTINEQRIQNRVASGGHSVPPDKIRPRYDRSLALLRRAIASSNRAYLFDNSEKQHRLVAEFEDDRLVAAAVRIPNWATGVLFPSS
jgi:predicted ABC-type ATPase